jgi:hypothetical protein
MGYNSRDVDCPEVKFEHKGEQYLIKHVVLVPFHQLVPSDRHPGFMELHFNDRKVANIAKDRVKDLHNPGTGDKLVIMFVVTHKLHALLGVNQQSEMMFIQDKFYKRATYSDLGKKNKEGLKLHVQDPQNKTISRLVYFLKECEKPNTDNELHLSLADAARRGVFDDNLKKVEKA